MAGALIPGRFWSWQKCPLRPKASIFSVTSETLEPSYRKVYTVLCRPPHAQPYGAGVRVQQSTASGGPLRALTASSVMTCRSSWDHFLIARCHARLATAVSPSQSRASPGSLGGIPQWEHAGRSQGPPQWGAPGRPEARRVYQREWGAALAG
jgi:hypothetical protein